MTSRKSLAAFVALAVAVAVLLAGCSSGSHTTKADAATTTTKPPAPIVAPLTGVLDPSGVSHRRPVVTVKIDNTQSQGLKYGVDQADVVYEEVVEGGITRLAAMFNSHAPDRVGPVRSVRKTDQSLVWPLGGIFVYSGGAPYAITSINTAPVKQLDETRAGNLMFRDHSKLAPWNLYAHVDQMLKSGGKPIPPPSLFVYRKPGVAAAGLPVSAVHVGFLAGYATDWNWDATTRTWKRSLFGRPELTAAGVPLAPKNVVVMFTQYPGGDPNHGNEGAEAQLVGTGNAWVFTGGHVVKGTWSRPDKSKPAQLLDAGGHQIRLTPGQTWVELPDSTYTVTTTP